LEALYLEALYLEALYLEALYLEALYLEALYLEALYLEALYMEALYLEALYLEALYLEALYPEPVTLRSGPCLKDPVGGVRQALEKHHGTPLEELGLEVEGHLQRTRGAVRRAIYARREPLHGPLWGEPQPHGRAHAQGLARTQGGKG
jgi:hypothetical protein